MLLFFTVLTFCQYQTWEHDFLFDYSETYYDHIRELITNISISYNCFCPPATWLQRLLSLSHLQDSWQTPAGPFVCDHELRSL